MFTVLKLPKTGKDPAEVLGEFNTEDEAQTFLNDAQTDDNGQFEFRIEHPPSIDPAK